ncbi:MAG: GNAT family N-acetyltransferase [Roseinatronobacter sp.]|nr:GNAT family N-acetyltransferase [Roseinatronobacter sp.]
MTPALAHTPVLETARLVLRAPVADDLPAFLAYATSARTRFVGGPKTAAQAVEKFAGMIGQWVLRGYGRFTITRRDGGAAIGHVGPLMMAPAEMPEFTWSLWGADVEGQGLGREAAHAMAAWAFGPLGLAQASTIIHDGNAASHRIAASLGGVARPDWPAHFGADFTTYHFTKDAAL